MRIDPYTPNHFLSASPISEVPRVGVRTEIDPSVGREANQSPTQQQPSAESSPPTAANLTPDTLRNVLVELGITPDNEAIQIAESLTRLGLPITDATIADARATLSRFPGVPTGAYAMARVLDVPMTGTVLKAFTQIVNGTISANQIPASIADQLGISLPATANPNQVVRELYQMVVRLGRSTEHTISIVGANPDTASRALFHADPRAQLLLTLAVNPNLSKELADAIEAHASHIEGQQLLNQSAMRQSNLPGQFYFAFPINMGETANTITELLVKRRDQEKHNASDDPESVVLQTTLRMSPPRLGQLEVSLRGTQNNRLGVSVLVAQTSTLRYLQRNVNELVTGLTTVGWTVKSFTLEQKTDFEPLWSGGTQLQHPRHRIDKIA